MFFLWTKSNSVFLPETQQWINSPCRVFSTIFSSRGKIEEILAKSISEQKIRSFNIIIAIGWVLEGKDSKYDMSCRQASLVSNELLTQKENCSWPKLKDKLRLDEKNFGKVAVVALCLRRWWGFQTYNWTSIAPPMHCHCPSNISIMQGKLFLYLMQKPRREYRTLLQTNVINRQDCRLLCRLTSWICYQFYYK